MSINMEPADETDYSSFEYQQINVNPTLEDAGNADNLYLAEFEPLESIGGLANNEVAELVYFELQASIEFEDEAATDPRQEIATVAELRGVLGANINVPNGLDAFSTPAGLEEGTGAAQAASEDRIFQLFTARAQAPSDSQNTDVPDSYIASAGGSADSGILYEKNWRELTGRGPVLDSSDDICVSGNLVVGNQRAGLTLGSIRVHLVWDVAETDDAGRAFSVPTDD